MTPSPDFLAGFAQAKEMAARLAETSNGYPTMLSEAIRALTPPAPEPLSKKSF